MNIFKHRHEWHRNASWRHDAGTMLLWDQCGKCKAIEVLYVKRIGLGAFDADHERLWLRLWGRNYSVDYVGAMEGRDPRGGCDAGD